MGRSDQGGAIRRRRAILLVLGLLVVLGLAFAANHASISALEEPGPLETYAATKAKQWLVSRSARGPLPAAPPDDATSRAAGQMLFSGRCAFCHGQDGREPTAEGRSMYPRAPALSSPRVQSWSDTELFWIVKHGIRLTGMPGFGRIHSDDEIWHLVHYVRSLNAQKR